MSDELKWSRDRHDKKVEGAKAFQSEQIKTEVLAKIGKRYASFKNALTHRRKPKVEDLHKFLADIEALVRTHCNHPSLDEWAGFTLRMLREKCEELRITGFKDCNCFTPVEQPVAPDSTTELPAAAQPVSLRYSFQTAQDFAAMDIIKRTAAAPAFVGFCLDANTLLAIFEDGAVRVMGQVSNGLGLERVPSRQELLAEMGKKKRRKP